MTPDRDRAVRVAGPADAAAVAELEAICLGPDAWSRGLVEEALGGGPATTRFLVAGDPVAGHAVFAVAGAVADLQRIAVAREHRRRGLAGQLLAAGVAWCRAEGADRLLLEVREDNRAALGFYAAAGFVEIDRRPRYYADGTAALVLELRLSAQAVAMATS